MQRLSKTTEGAAAFRERSPLMSLRQRSIFLLCDGQRSVAAVLTATAAVAATQADVDHLVAQGFLAAAETADAELLPASAVPTAEDTPPAADGRSLFVEHWTLF